ncbi:hypothetical protein NP493_1961g00000 [Ridgeia piscesae]|uniref:Uncharacterized protein n=1 Tax=Ridgeia piscesae TaxID=27915 RepID=A0AAD9JR09_RIDPI|nr:hypothetical protein NP493_1961g00000 [Ridgeia piscesae]
MAFRPCQMFLELLAVRIESPQPCHSIWPCQSRRPFPLHISFSCLCHCL